MSKKEFLELLIRSYGLKPEFVRFYKTDSNGGEYQTGTGWQGSGVDESGKHVINFQEPDGFNMAVYEILRQGQKLKPVFVNP
jgi:hypothetical protein